MSNLYFLCFLLKQSKQTKTVDSVQASHNLPELDEFVEALVLSSEVPANLRSTFSLEGYHTHAREL